jgi:hypothetical protein
MGFRQMTARLLIDEGTVSFVKGAWGFVKAHGVRQNDGPSINRPNIDLALNLIRP